jgi:hypothetical protein
MPRSIPNSNVAATRLIERLLAALFETVPNASLVGMNRLNADADQALTGRLRSRATTPVECHKQSGGSTRQKRVAADWNAILAPLRAGQCLRLEGAELRSAPIRDRVRLSHMARVMVCPASGPSGDLLGAVFIAWDGTNRPPEGAALTNLMEAGARLGQQIAAVLDLCGQAAASMPCRDVA